MIYLGTNYGGWTIEESCLTSKSIIWSAGIGEDISFDLELIKLSNVFIHGFDPTPRSLKWLETQHIPENFIVHKYGISNVDGLKPFLFPEKEEYVSFKEDTGLTEEPKILLPTKQVTTIMKELGHKSIDVFKMDIEGSEYAVIDDLITNKIFPHQLLIEFHYRSDTIDYVNKLIKHYNLLERKNKDFSFIKRYPYVKNSYKI